MEHWNWRQRSLAVIVWPAFIAACLATLLFFAMVDATQLGGAFVFDVDLGHQAIYSIGFFFFWFIGLLATGMSTWLIRTERRRADFPLSGNDQTGPTDAEN